MSTSAVKSEALVVEVSCTADVFRATLADGRSTASHERADGTTVR